MTAALSSPNASHTEGIHALSRPHTIGMQSQAPSDTKAALQPGVPRGDMGSANI